MRRGGGGNSNPKESNDDKSRNFSSSAEKDKKYVKLSNPAPGSPFHYAFPVHDLGEAKHFYGEILGCKEGRSSDRWQDYSLNGHQIVCHYVGADYRCQDYHNPVDGDDVPVPHAGLALTEEQFHDLAGRVRKAGVEFIIEPHLRFKGKIISISTGLFFYPFQLQRPRSYVLEEIHQRQLTVLLHSLPLFRQMGPIKVNPVSSGQCSSKTLQEII